MKACKRIVASLAVVALGYGSAAQAASIYNNIVSDYGAVDVYHMDETSGTTMIDSAGGDNGVYSGGFTLGVPGPRPPAFPGFDPTNDAVTFDGATGAATVGTTNLSAVSTTYSVAFWFNMTETGGLDYLFGRGTSGGYDTIGVDGNELIFYDGPDEQLTGFLVTAGNWYNLVLTRNGSDVNVYLNGVNEISISGAALNPFASSTSITVAERPDTGGKSPATIDEVSLYNTELTPAQVGVLFNLPEPASLGLLAIGGVTLLRRRRA